MPGLCIRNKGDGPVFAGLIVSSRKEIFNSLETDAFSESIEEPEKAIYTIRLALLLDGEDDLVREIDNVVKNLRRLVELSRML